MHNREYNGLEVAVIGMSCRFPGAKNVHEFWGNLKEGKESITRFSKEEMIESGVPGAFATDRNYIGAKGYLPDGDKFDASFFGYSKSEAQFLDPQTRIFHECAWEALEDAGYVPSKYKGKIGLFAGSAISIDWLTESLAHGMKDLYNFFMLPQLSTKDFLSTRVSYKLNLNGPSNTLFTACSTGLVCVHQAIQSILSGECHMALAGAVSLSFPEKHGYMHQEGMLYSKDGHCRPFDSNASGTVFGNGIGIVALKPLEDAIADKDRIYAVVKGSALNNDGNRKVGFTAPSIEGQAEVIRMAMSVAETPADSISYIEAHGTGTEMGDPIELEALDQAFKTAKKQICGIGSVKSNIGHLDTAAGISGFIKTVLALYHRYLPPTINYEKPNPHINFEHTPFKVQYRGHEWGASADSVLRAGVSSFGIGGTNAHVILEDYQRTLPKEVVPQHLYFFPYSAQNRDALNEYIAEHSKFLAKPSEPDIAAYSYALCTRRTHFKVRKSFLFENLDELKLALSEYVNAPHENGSENPVNEVVFMFPSQGVEYTGVAKDLYESIPYFKKEIDSCASLVETCYGYEVIRKACLGTIQTDDLQKHGQLVTFVIEYVLAKLLIQAGIKPVAMIGHSMGEYAAACIAGVISLVDTIKLIHTRELAMQKSPQGGMLSVQTAADEVRGHLFGSLNFAAINGKNQCVVSGTAADIEKIQEIFSSQSIVYIPIDRRYGYHSAAMDLAADEIEGGFTDIELKRNKIPYISSVSGTWITENECTSPTYYKTQFRETVAFHKGISELLKKPSVAFLEVGPGNALSTFLKAHAGLKKSTQVLTTIRHQFERKPDFGFLLSRIGELWQQGMDINWEVIYGENKKPPVSMPHYAFQRMRYWPDNLGKKSLQENKPHSTTKQAVHNWIYHPSWKQSILTGESVGTNEGYLVFDNGSDLCRQVCKALSQERDIVIIRRGTSYGTPEEGIFEVDPINMGDLHRLVSELKEDQKLPTNIVSFWNDLEQESQDSRVLIKEVIDQGYLWLLGFAKALHKAAITREVRLTVLASGLFNVLGEKIFHPEKALLLGPLKVIPLEYQNFSCKCIDLGTGSEPTELFLKPLLQELVTKNTTPIVALRNNLRWIQDHQKLSLKGQESKLCFRNKGTYLITGGLGDIGFEIGRYLSERYKAKLLLLGNSYFPEKETWDDWQKNHTAANPVSIKIKKLKEIEALGGDIEVFITDISDEGRITELLAAIKAKYKLNGVIHAAGRADGALIQNRDTESSMKVLLPKVLGLQNLMKSLMNESLDFFINFSSIHSIVTNVGQVAYVAANSYLDSASDYYAAKVSYPVKSVNWDLWQQIGMAKKEERKRSLRNLITSVQLTEILPGHEILKASDITKDKLKIFKAELNAKEQWFLNEHRIKSNAIMLGTAYIQIAGMICEQLNLKQHQFSDIHFIRPLMVSDTEKAAIYIFLNRNSTGYEFGFYTSQSPSGQWILHARGQIDTCGVILKSEANLNIDEIIQSCTIDELTESSHNLDLYQESFIQVGRRWRTLKKAWVGENKAVGYFKLDAEFIPELNTYTLHPALFDFATSFVALMDYIPKNTAGYLPFSYKNIKVYRDMPGAIYSYVRCTNPGTLNKLEFDVQIVSEEGAKIVDIEKFTLLTVDSQGKEIINRLSQKYANSLYDINYHLNGNDNKESNLKEIYKLGITPDEGIAVFDKYLGISANQIIVSTYDLKKRFHEAFLNQQETTKEVKQSHQPKRVNQQRNQLVDEVTELWKSELQAVNIEPNDDFFQLGGDSIRILNITAKIKEKYGYELSVADLYNSPTVNAIVDKLVGVPNES